MLKLLITLVVLSLYPAFADRQSTLYFHGKKVQFTKHAQCRMKCREITEPELADVIENGNWNNLKSGKSKKEKQCPTRAIEGKTKDHQNVRVVLAECPRVVKVVTVIDLGVEHPCSCP